MDTEAARPVALVAASGVAGAGTSPAELTAYADQLIPWLTAAPATRLDVTVSLDGIPVLHSSNGGTMAATLTLGTNTKVDITALPKDAGGNVTPDVIAFTTDDTGNAVLTPSMSADGRTWTGTAKGVTGTVNVTANDTTTAGIPASVTTVNVVAGVTTHIDTTVTVT